MAWLEQQPNRTVPGVPPLCDSHIPINESLEVISRFFFIRIPLSRETSAGTITGTITLNVTHTLTHTVTPTLNTDLHRGAAGEAPAGGDMYAITVPAPGKRITPLYMGAEGIASADVDAHDTYPITGPEPTKSKF